MITDMITDMLTKPHHKALSVSIAIGILGAWLILCGSATQAQSHTPPPVLVPAGATWAYCDDGSDQGEAWRANAFDDSAWKRGPAPLGYGDPVSTTLSRDHVTTYFRHTFTVTQPSAYPYLNLRLRKDDGAVVYTNGVEAYRFNMPAGPITYTTLAASELASDRERVFANLIRDGSVLITGANTVAVEVHQVKQTSGDILMDLELRAPITAAVAPRNVILFIGDGMGPEQIRAAGMYRGSRLFLEAFPYSTTMATHSADNLVTDSAAAATAMATGVKVNNYIVSQATPGDGHDMETLVELFHRRCKKAGIVTTAYATHATPAGFGAHEADRNNLAAIAADYLAQSRPDLLLGGGGNGMTPVTATLAGYTVVTDRVELQVLVPISVGRVSGQFGAAALPYEYDGVGYATLPHLSEMVTAALALLEDAPHGFFLMVEGARIDQAGHDNRIDRNVFETLELDRAVEVAYRWAVSRTDTLIIVTADHETGGLYITHTNGTGDFPAVSWATIKHTGIHVPVYAWGANAALAEDVRDNTDIYWFARAGLPTTGEYACSASAVRRTEARATASGIPLMMGLAALGGAVLTLAGLRRTYSSAGIP